MASAPATGSTTINLNRENEMPTTTTISAGTGDGGPSPITLYDEKIRLMLVAFVFLSFDGFLFMIGTANVDHLSDTIKGMILGAMLTWVGCMVSYYWGSSSSSSRKDSVLFGGREQPSIVSGSVIGRSE